MIDPWPWLVVAGLGALHGLAPANGWMFAAACGMHGRDQAQAWRALVPLGLGHAASIAAAAGAFAIGVSMDPLLARHMAGALLIGVATWRCLRDATPGKPIDGRLGQAGIALWSFLMATAHGAGLMLVPALAPLCLSGATTRGITGTVATLALAGVALHLAAMLATTGLVAAGVSRGLARHPRWLEGRTLPRAWTAMLAVTGVVLLVHRQ